MSVWENGLTKDNVTDLILTGFKDSPNKMTHSKIIEQYCKGGNTILDFGCGVGRNSHYLKDKYQNVISYDLPSMLQFYPQEFKSDNITITSDWNWVKTQKVDEVLCSLVLQHLRPTDLERYLNDLLTISDRFIILSRTWQDYTNERTISILKKYFTIELYSKVNSDHFIGVFRNKIK